MASEPASLGVTSAPRALTVVVDYAAPNAAKQMHVGHLRSTIIGDSLVRLLDLVGHKVVRENHIGDWGAPFGMLIEHLLDVGEEVALHERALGDLEQFYQSARSAYDNDPAFADRARARVVLLQSGDPETLRLWDVLVRQSVSYFDDSFRRLGTKLTRDDVVAESYYNPLLPGVVRDLAEKGILVESDGARCVFPPGYTNRGGDPLPLIIQNSVGGYTYAATDLAAVRDRVDRLGAELLSLRRRSAASRPPGNGLHHRPPGRVVTRGDRGSTRGVRERPRPGREDVQDQAGRHCEARRTARRGRPTGQGCHRQAWRRRGQVPNGGAELGRARGGGAAVGIGAVKYADLSTDRTR